MASFHDGAMFLCAGHGVWMMGWKSPVGCNVRNHEPKATAVSRGIVGRKQWILMPDTHSEARAVTA